MERTCWWIYLHKSLCHCGPTLLLCSAGKRLHVIGARRLSRRICSKCVTCRRYRPRLQQQMMGDLPPHRVTNTGVPFDHTGLDYAGPFPTKAGRVRNPVHGEAHICVFVCLVTKAVHLEVVSDQTTAAFRTGSLQGEDAPAISSLTMEGILWEPETTCKDSTDS